MKKHLLLLLAIFPLFAFAQSPRLCLYEDFTSMNCPYSHPADNQLEPLMTTNAGKIVHLSYPVAFGNDLFYNQNSAQDGARAAYYSMSSFPTGWIDGLTHTLWPQLPTQLQIDSAFAVQSPFAITVVHSFNTAMDSVFISVFVTCTQNIIDSSAVLQVALTEKNIHFTMPPGTNGETDFHCIMRKMYPSANGTPLDTVWTVGQTQTFSFVAKIANAFVYSTAQIAVVAFIQDNATKHVLQAGHSLPLQVADDAGVWAINGTTPYSCSSSINPSVTIYNYGNNVLTSCTINYKIDNGPLQMLNWSGSLNPFAGINQILPTIALSAGPHTLISYTTLPNGNTDQNFPNDNNASSFVIFNPNGIALPITEGFENTLFPSSGWILENQDASFTWRRDTFCGGFGNSSASANLDFFNYYDEMISNNAIGQNDYLYAPTLDLSNAIFPATLEFDVAYAQFDSSYVDQLSVEISEDCGTTWGTAYLRSGVSLATAPDTTARFRPSASQWRSESIDISQFIGQSEFLLRFKTTNGFGNDLYVDNINIHDATSGIDQISIGNGLTVYPNPFSVSTTITIENEHPDLNSEIHVFDVTGKMVLTQLMNGNTVTIERNDLPAGIYFFRIGNDSANLASGKFIVE